LRLPYGIAFADASLVEPLACVVKGLRRAHVRDGDTVYVIGLGMMGLMHVLALRSIGARVRIVASDFIAERRAFAERYGATTIHPDEAASMLGKGADKVFCLPGTPHAMRAAFAAVSPGGTVVMFTPFEPDAAVPIDPEQFYFRDLTLVASYSCGPDDTRASLQLIERSIVTAEKLGATLLPIDGVAQAYRDLRQANITKPIVCFP
jgi:L-iditol 2-dehydrogenase